MKCPRCGELDDKVLESRLNKDGNAIRRRRECLSCHLRFTSYERIEEKPIIVFKKDGSTQPFDRSKVERGIRTCTEKLKIPEPVLQRLMDDIEDDVDQIAGHNRTISSAQIGEAALKELYKVSKVAYVRFASVYREFDDLDKFIDEIENIAKKVRQDDEA